ncbi:MAG: hypothetical protein CMO80_00890 [Verrucomicrobiales bacterium]|nr:hypothetical protein [Verrucomicrobiales bacterium]|tara:strand:+ start:978 stop:1481 length:504 start_codon:yes stop_codon:yes gene_type:complete
MEVRDSSAPGAHAGKRQFQTTHWSVVIRAMDSDSRAGVALEEFCRTYWFPLCAFVRRSGRARHDAEDLTQGFFAGLLQNSGRDIDPEKGRFRSYLLPRLDRVAFRLRSDYERGGKERVFDALNGHLAGAKSDYESLAERIGMTPGRSRWPCFGCAGDMANSFAAKSP